MLIGSTAASTRPAFSWSAIAGVGRLDEHHVLAADATAFEQERERVRDLADERRDGDLPALQLLQRGNRGVPGDPSEVGVGLGGPLQTGHDLHVQALLGGDKHHRRHAHGDLVLALGHRRDEHREVVALGPHQVQSVAGEDAGPLGHFHGQRRRAGLVGEPHLDRSRRRGGRCLPTGRDRQYTGGDHRHADEEPAQ